MDPRSLHRAASELLARALELPEAQRRAYLVEQCRGNQELESEVLTLLDRLHTDADEALLASTKPLKEFPTAQGTLIGDYRVLELLGEGGMGQVFRAYKETPPQREVALKLIRAGMQSKSILARFDQERNALTVMNHPNIAGILDAGQTPFGQPYFVMELVRGVEITRYCDQLRLSIPERLELFDQVCQGVQHAHQKGIIHRDLKPSNILVVEEEGRRTAKIIDFGVAKAIERRLTDQTLFTEMGAILGTPEYMSPEQTERSGLDIDTRTDVYSLGVVLYELLTGTLPFDRRTLKDAAVHEIYRVIREVDPARPSTHFSRPTETSAKAAEQRRTKPQKLAGQIQGDLDWIVMKALEKDRSRRYASPLDLAADLKRHLENQPVHAGPPSTVYRLRKFVRRNRALVTMSVFGVIALSTVAVTTAIQAYRVSKERNRAEEALATLNEVVEYQSSMITGVNAEEVGKSLRKNLLDRMSSASTHEGDNPSSRGTADSLLASVNMTDLAIQMVDEAILLPSLEAIEEGLSARPVVGAKLLSVIGLAYETLTLYEKAESALRQAVKIQTAALGSDALETLQAKYDLAVLLSSVGRYADAETLLHDIVRGRRAQLGPEDPLTLLSESFLASMYSEQGKYDLAEPLLQRVLARQREVLGSDHGNTRFSIHVLGRLYIRWGHLDQAESLLEESFATAQRLMKQYPTVAATALADLYVLQNRFDEAEAIYLKVLDIGKKTGGDKGRLALASLANLASFYVTTGEYEKAEPYFQEGLEGWRRLDASHVNTLYMEYTLAIMYKKQGRLADAEKQYRRVLDLMSAPLGDGTKRQTVLYNLASTLALRGNGTEAMDLLEEAIDAGFEDLSLVQTDPAWQDIASTPRFQELIESKTDHGVRP